MSQPIYSTADVCRLTGLTARQLQWWDERGLLPVRVESHRRQYTEEDIVRAGVFQALRAKRISLSKIEKISIQCRKLNGAQFLVTDGNRVAVYRNAQMLAQGIALWNALVAVVWLTPLKAKVKGNG